MLPNRDILITVFHLFGVYSISNLNYYPDTVPHYFQSNRDEIRSANLALMNGCCPNKKPGHNPGFL